MPLGSMSDQVDPPDVTTPGPERAVRTSRRLGIQLVDSDPVKLQLPFESIPLDARLAERMGIRRNAEEPGEPYEGDVVLQLVGNGSHPLLHATPGVGNKLAPTSEHSDERFTRGLIRAYASTPLQSDAEESHVHGHISCTVPLPFLHTAHCSSATYRV